MRGLTLHQPYASLIAIGAKTLETRSWGTAYRGPLLIHAARLWSATVRRDYRQYAAILEEEGYRPSLLDQPWRPTCGHALALVDLVDCHQSEGEENYPERERLFGDLRPGRWVWALQNVRPLSPPVPCGGCRGLWPVYPQLLAQLEKETSCAKP